MKYYSLALAAATICLPGSLTAADCPSLPSQSQLQDYLKRAPDQGGKEGGFFDGKREWAVVVNREGEICAITESTTNRGYMWPGSLSIAEAKAYTANAFSTDDKPMSTARLYTFTQPGHSLWGIAASNPFVAADVEPPAKGPTSGNGKVTGGLIAFGGGLALYKNGKIVGALGVSGDTACADHETAKRIRNEAGLNPADGMHVDDITYPSIDGPTVFSHPLCQNTYRDGKFLGNEAVASFDQGRAAEPSGSAERSAERKKKSK
jgi:uncharacterized protein GlcG (DUF336 family)